MNKFTQRELEKVRNLIQKEWDGSTTHLIIPADFVEPVNIGDRLTVRLDDSILNQPPNFHLSENWNANTFPPEKVLDIEVARIEGTMIGVRAVGKYTQLYWEGWLPNTGFVRA